MSLSPRDRKILWSRSGNVCAFPGCAQELIEPGTLYGDGVVVGEEAHIIARASSGPRGAIVPDINLHSCINIILLCPTHHSIVDAQPDIYTDKVLHAMKYQHETAVRERQRSLTQLSALGARAYDSACGGRPAVGAWRSGASLVIACSYGSSPVLSNNGHWRGSGLAFQHIHDQLGRETIFDSSEAEPDIEYWLENSTFTIIQTTYEPQSRSIAPFVGHSFDLGNLPASHRIRLLLPTSLAAKENLSTIVQSLKCVTREGSLHIEEALYRIRNIGLISPDTALSAIDSLRGQWWFDGGNAEVAQSISHELQLVKKSEIDNGTVTKLSK